ncbi:hypothetical protein JCM11491_005682 [Sporobolomyces phaffii]
MATLEQDRNATKADVYWLVGWTAVLLWDNIITISSAHRYLLKAKWTPMKGLFILNRYGTVIFQTLCMLLVVLAVPMNLCRSIFWFQCFALVFVISTCSFIVSIRCYALYDRSRRIMILLLFMLAVEIGVLIGTVSQLRPLVLSPGASLILDFHGCVAVAASSLGRKLSLIFWSSTLGFNAVVFGLSTSKSVALTRRIGHHLTIVRRLSRAGALYYAVILATNVACVVFYSQSTKPLQTFNTPASVVLVSLMSSRLIISLWDENYRSSRLSLDSFTTLDGGRSPRGGGGGGGARSPPPSSTSPKFRFRLPTTAAAAAPRRPRDSADYDKVGPLESKLDPSSSWSRTTPTTTATDAFPGPAGSLVPTLSYSGVPIHHYWTSSSSSTTNRSPPLPAAVARPTSVAAAHSRTGSIATVPSTPVRLSSTDERGNVVVAVGGGGEEEEEEEEEGPPAFSLSDDVHESKSSSDARSVRSEGPPPRAGVHPPTDQKKRLGKGGTRDGTASV